MDLFEDAFEDAVLADLMAKAARLRSKSSVKVSMDVDVLETSKNLVEFSQLHS